MKEIDFLPKWYHVSRRRNRLYNVQYIALGGVLVLMALWVLWANYSCSRLSAAFKVGEQKRLNSEEVLKQYAAITKEVSELSVKADTLDKIDSRISLVNVLAELSFLVDERVVLSDVEIVAEPIKAGSNAGENQEGKNAPVGGVKFKVTLSGAAIDTKDVAELVCRLEESPYFCSIVPSFSGSRMMMGASSNLVSNKGHINEFKIGCYIANYKEAKKQVAKVQ